MRIGETALRDLVERMLELTPNPSGKVIDENGNSFTVTIAGARIGFQSDAASCEPALEQLATAIEASIAFARANAMLAATGGTPDNPPLWLVTGSDALAKWLVWSRTENALRRVLTLTDRADYAPVVGYLDRRARRELGQGAAKVWVRGGMAIAQRIELPGRLRCTAMFGRKAEIRIEGTTLPETVIDTLSERPGRGCRRLVADIVGHPFFAEADLRLGAIRNDGDTVIIDVQSRWAPVAPVPDAAKTVIPSDADPVYPWRITPAEFSALYALVAEGRADGGII